MAEDGNTFQSCNERNITYEMPWPAYSVAFQIEFHLITDKNYALLCKLCIGKKLIRKSSSANLKKHLQVNIILILILYLVL